MCIPVIRFECLFNHLPLAPTVQVSTALIIWSETLSPIRRLQYSYLRVASFYHKRVCLVLKLTMNLSIQSNYIYIHDFVSSLQLSTRPILDLQAVTPNTYVSSTVPIVWVWYRHCLTYIMRQSWETMTSVTCWDRSHGLPDLSHVWQNVKLSDALSWGPSAI